MAKTRSVAKPIDPLNVDARLYEQVSLLLDQLQDPGVSIRERIMALAAIARIRISYVKLNDNQDSADAGSTLRKYSEAFANNAITGRGKRPRRATAADDAADDAEWDEVLNLPRA